MREGDEEDAAGAAAPGAGRAGAAALSTAE
ncbi:hypothetical protein JOC45_003407 [Gordonia hydrophobica]|nr:hypothetical protein [Gordonia hydrophobica]